jgi:hypothetical protein
MISIIPSCAHHRHVPLCFKKQLQELKIENSYSIFTGQSTSGISTKFYRSGQRLRTILSCIDRQHVSCTKWLPEIRIEKSCRTFTGHTTGGISTKFYRSDQYHSKLCTSPAFVTSLHKINARAKIEKSYLAFTGQSTSGILIKFYRSDQNHPNIVVHIASMFPFAAQNGHQS